MSVMLECGRCTYSIVYNGHKTDSKDDECTCEDDGVANRALITDEFAASEVDEAEVENEESTGE